MFGIKRHRNHSMDEEAGYGREEGNRLGGVRPDDQAKEGVELIDHHHSKISDLKDTHRAADESSEEEEEEEDENEEDDDDEEEEEEEGGVRKGRRKAGGTWFKGYTLGLTWMGIGLVVLAVAGILHKAFPELYKRKLRDKLVVTSMAQAEETVGWLGDSSLHTPTHIGLHFYNLTNAADFLGGALPAFELVGPFTYRQFRRRTDVVFAPDGSYVDFTTNFKAVLQPELTFGGTDSWNITSINTAYATGVARKLAESNMVRIGVPRILSPFRDKGLPQLSLDIRALTAYIRGLLDTGKDLGISSTAAAQFWNETQDFSLVALNTPEAQARRGLLLYTGSPAGRAAIPKEVEVGAGLTDAQVDEVAAYVMRILSAPEVEARVLKAVGLDEAVYPTVDALVMRQFTMADVLGILGGAPEALQGISLPQVNQGNIYVEESLTPGPATEAVPMIELGYILRSAKTHAFLPAPPSLPTWLPPATPRSVAELKAQGWGDVVKGECIFDVLLTNRTYFENAVLGIPAFLLEDDFTHLHASMSSPLVLGGVEECLAVGPMLGDGTRAPTPDWADLQTYLNFVGKSSIEPLFRFIVINNNGGLVSTRTVKELALGHQEPLLTLSLGADAPSAFYSLLSNTEGPLDAPHAFCTSSADVNHALYGCFLDTEASTPTKSVYRKTPSRYATGKADISDVQQLQAYAGLTGDVPVMYPSGQRTPVAMPDAVAELASSIPLSTSLRRTQTETFPPPESINASYSPSAIQRGFSTGEQFPPFLLQDLPSPPPLWVLRLKGPIVIRFSYTNNTKRHGIPLRRFTLSQDLFEARDDLALIDVGAGELAVRQSTFMNVTLGTWMPTFMADSPSAGFQFMPAFAASSPQVLEQAKGMEGTTYIDVEPMTGKSLSRRTQAQLSISTSSPGSGAYDLFYDEAYKGPFLPTVFMVTETFLDKRDASGIRAALYTPGKVVNGIILSAIPVGIIMFLLGLVVLGKEGRADGLYSIGPKLFIHFGRHGTEPPAIAAAQVHDIKQTLRVLHKEKYAGVILRN
ncbi:cd36-like class b scavenger receptor [Nannochloropsis gaditana]|uniref:Cd36-like class b scavenger receptor n=1 Tax=Nannochloropsis gaditana TaxID=72520 RepID=W7U6I4_9STRA|nr:cd36-like class b scavenger receptor [Nannochloropsis gaditana]